MLTLTNQVQAGNLFDIGYAADIEVKQLLAKGTIAEEAALEFRMQCNSGLCKATSSLLEKCLDYILVRNLASLNPSQIAKDPAKSKEKFKSV